MAGLMQAIEVSNKGVIVPKSLEDMHSTFIRNVSHELRTPLTVLRGYAELLQAGDLGELAPEQQEALFLIMNRAEEMQTIVDRVSTLLTIQSNMTIPQPLSLAALVAQMVEIQRHRAQEAGITFEVDLAHDVPQISGDALQLQEALECMLENAFKFTPNGGNVQVRVYSQDDQVCISVKDTGIGMDESEIEQLSIPFHQGDGSTTRQYGGLGLGMTIVKQVVDAHHGVLEVTSQPGAGSEFTLKFAALSRVGPEGRPALPDGATRRILVVDDEEFVAFTLQEGLERLPNCEVVVTNSGTDALRLFKEAPFDLLITDYKMPDMNGVMLATEVRRLSPTTSIIMVTAYSNHLIRETSAAAAFNRVLDKPVRLSDIRDAALESLGDANIGTD